MSADPPSPHNLLLDAGQSHDLTVGGEEGRAEQVGGVKWTEWTDFKIKL